MNGIHRFDEKVEARRYDVSMMMVQGVLLTLQFFCAEIRWKLELTP